eukprot:TRINITY_DN434_c0_g3_i1.p1 TRINITY_DN434_c0_g3~~TRINITY_DN434_c0_g3_i1.p1  ORF type:complete len:1160 (-),score=260.52 TRINITY_DN434_c0_g3_i1:143-3622(-)
MTEIHRLETVVTAAVVGAIRATKLHCTPILATPYGQNVIETCKLAGQSAVMYKNQMNTLKRPYIVQKSAVVRVVGVIIQVMDRLEQLVTGVGVQTQQQQQSRQASLTAIEAAKSTANQTLSWLDTSSDSYAKEGEVLASVEGPRELDQIALEMNSAPRWIIKELFDARAALAIAPGNEKAQLTLQRIQDETAAALRNAQMAQGTSDRAVSEKLKAELAKAKAKITQQTTFIDQLKAQLKTTAGVGQAAQQRETVIEEQTKTISGQDQKISELSRALAESQNQANRLTKQMNLYKERDGAMTEQLNHDIASKAQQIVDRDEHIKKLSLKLKQLFDTVGSYKKRETSHKNALSAHLEKEKQLEAKLRVSQAQLRMSRVTSVDTGPTSTDDVFKATLMADLEQIPHGEEIVQIDKLLADLLDEHQAANDELGALALESAQIMEQEEPPLEVEWDTASHWITETEKRECMSVVLLDTAREYEVIRMLGEVFLAGKSADNIVKSLLNLHHRRGGGLDLIKHMIDTEIKRTKSPIQLFRGEEFPARMIRAHSRLTGLRFARDTLGPLIEKIINQQVQIELDPNRLENSEVDVDVKRQQELLIQYCQDFFDAIVESIHTMPLSFFEIANHLTKRTRHKWPEPEAVQGAVAGYMFLRFFCPCIASPESFAFPNVGPMPVRRTLLLIGKVLQSLANGVTDFKEPYLMCMGTFIRKNQLKLDSYIKHVMEWPPRAHGDQVFLKTAEVLLKDNEETMQKLLENQQNEFHTLATTVWKQNLETSPSVRMNSVLGRLAMMEPAGPVPKLNRFQFPKVKDEKLCEALLLTFLDSEAVPIAITKTLQTQTNSPILGSVLHHLSTLFLANESFDLLVKTVILTEIQGAMSAYHYLHDSISKALLMWYCKNYAASWLLPLWTEIVDEIITKDLYLEVDPSSVSASQQGSIDIHANRVKITQVFNDLVSRALGEDLQKCPYPIWWFHSILADYTSQDVFQFLVVNFLAHAIEDPVGYSLTTKALSRESQQTFELLSDMFRKLGNKKDILIGNIKVDESARSGWLSDVDEWATTDSEFLVDVEPNLNWRHERDSLMDLIDFVHANQQEINGYLELEGAVQHNVSFTLNEVLQGLTNGTVPEWPIVLPYSASSGPNLENPMSAFSMEKDKKGKKAKKGK